MLTLVIPSRQNLQFCWIWNRRLVSSLSLSLIFIFGEIDSHTQNHYMRLWTEDTYQHIKAQPLLRIK